MNNDDTFNSNSKSDSHTNPDHGGHLPPDLEARVVAWVLGEASDFEVAELTRLCAEQPELAVFKRRIEAINGLVRVAARPQTQALVLSPERRAKVLALIGGEATAKPATTRKATPRANTIRKDNGWLAWRAWALPAAACFTVLVVLSAMAIPAFQKVRETSGVYKQKVMFEAAEPAPVEHRLQVARRGGSNREEMPPSSFADSNDASSRAVADSTANFSLTLPDMPTPEASSSSSGVVEDGMGLGGFGGGGLGGREFAQSKRPNPSAAVLGQEGAKMAAKSTVYADTLDTQYASDYVYRASEGLSPGSDSFAPAPPVVSAPTKKKQTVTITAGTPQEFTDRESAIEELKSDQDQRLAGVDYYFAPPSADEPRMAFLGRTSSAEGRSRRSDVNIPAAVSKSAPQLPIDESLRAEIATSVQAVSTFSLHVSDASFRIAQAALARGELPDPSTVRPEEFYNAFDYGDAAPVAGEPVACRIEQAAHPFLQQRNLVRIAMKVSATGRSAAQPLRLTVLLDTSGSMEREDRAATVRAALGSLASLLGPTDRVTLIGFARTPRLLAANVRGDQAARLVEIAAQTPAEGGTNLEEALLLAGEQARRLMVPNAQNRIVLLTDGAVNLGNAEPQRLAERIEAFRHEGIAFDACGVVADGLDDGVLEALTRKGDGRYMVLNSSAEADANFARQLAGAFRPAAKDVKVQVRFNPARVSSYRLIGFEQHRLRTEDFRNNKIDAAELAAEEAANALYQVQVLPEGEGELGEVFVRFLDPTSGRYVERSWVLGYDAHARTFDQATPAMQLVGSAAFLAEKLRGGELAGQVRLDAFAPIINGLSAAYPGVVRVNEFIEMFRQTRRVLGE